MQRLSRLTLFFIFVFTCYASQAKEPTVRSVNKTLRSYIGQIKSQRSKQGRVRSANKLKKYVASLNTKESGKKFKYFFSLQDSYNSIKTANLSAKSCKFMKTEVKFKYGYIGTTPKRKVHYPVRHALDTIDALCRQ